MKIGSAEHKAWQKENGRKLLERLEKTVKSGPKSNGLFDSMSHSFSSNLLNSMKSRKVTK